MVFPSCFRTPAWRFLTVAVWAAARTASALPLTEADVCVFGGASGGLAAAVQAARLSRSVVIIEPGRHLGGMTSSGLGVTDRGSPEVAMGATRHAGIPRVPPAEDIALNRGGARTSFQPRKTRNTRKIRGQ
ncbi:MAG: FAD-dependent oxidoreductase [Verrucomicrobiales bacterium]